MLSIKLHKYKQVINSHTFEEAPSGKRARKEGSGGKRETTLETEIHRIGYTSKDQVVDRLFCRVRN